MAPRPIHPIVDARLRDAGVGRIVLVDAELQSTALDP